MSLLTQNRAPDNADRANAGSIIVFMALGNKAQAIPSIATARKRAGMKSTRAGSLYFPPLWPSMLLKKRKKSPLAGPT